MKTTQDILSYLQPLADKWYISLDESAIINVVGGSAVATVRRPYAPCESGKFFKNGVRCSKAVNGFELTIESSFYTLPVKEQEMILTHEFGHILQYEYMTNDELTEVRNMSVDKGYNSVTGYTKNMLEVMAECFAINELGISRHSKKGAKDNSLVSSALNTMLDYSPWEA